MNRVSKRLVKIFTMLAVLSALAVSAFAQEMQNKMDDKMMMKDSKPTVVIVRANWCPACQKIEPFMKELMNEYADRLNFVVLDVTDENTSKTAQTTAEKHGLGKFFAANKSKTSTIAIFDAKHKVVFKTDHNYEREAYVKAFDNAIEMGKMMKG
ncbi:MAG: thioredoxin domain-containing protein [Acidobacteriota bacterium]